MMNQGMVSIIVPVYNVENYLRECVDSILNQTYKNFELLLVDDGSKDSSPAICDEYAQKDSRVVVIHKENEGPSLTRNRGIDEAKGEFIVFVDSDDLILPEMLEKMTTAINRYQTDLCLCGFERFKEGWSKKWRLSPYSLVMLQGQKELAGVYTKSETNMFGVSIWAKMYRTEIINREHIRFRADIDYEEDCCFNLDYFRHVNTACALNDYFYRYRQMEQSLSKRYRKNTFRFLVNGYSLRRAYVEELGMEDCLKKVDAILLVVIKSTLIKIFESDMPKQEKYEEYKKVMEFDECQMVAKEFFHAKSRLTRMIAKTVVTNNPGKVHRLLLLWKNVDRVKRLLKKILRRIKRR